MNGATIRDLLAMESGIPDPDIGPEFWAAGPSHVWTIQDVLATVPGTRTAPGVGFVYEDANYMLLALVIEEATGVSVAQALRGGALADPRLASIVDQPDVAGDPRALVIPITRDLAAVVIR